MTRSYALLFGLVMTCLSMAVIASAFTYKPAVARLNAVVTDPLDPSDCSRGVDEANESECLDGGQ